MIAGVLLIFSMIVIAILVYACIWQFPSTHVNTVNKYYNKISKLADNLDNEEEKEMYLKIFKRVNSISPEYIEEIKVNGKLHSIDIDNISFIVDMVEDLNSSSVIKYECAWLSVKSGDETLEIGLGSSKAIKIRDLLLEFAMWRLEEYYKQLDKDERNKENERERKMFKECIAVIGHAGHPTECQGCGNFNPVEYETDKWYLDFDTFSRSNFYTLKGYLHFKKKGIPAFIYGAQVYLTNKQKEELKKEGYLSSTYTSTGYYE